MINGKNFEHKPISELMSIVKEDLSKLDDEGLIDEGKVIKTIMACNAKLGIPIREVKERVLPVIDNRAYLPVDFEKLYYVCKISDETELEIKYKNPFDNSFDRDIIYEAQVSRGDFGNTPHYQVKINKLTNVVIKQHSDIVELEVAPNSLGFCMSGCPSSNKLGRKQISIDKEGVIHCPFEKGEIYMMFVGNMMDEEGNLLFPFHPLITPWYEWCIKEKIIMDAIFNSDGNYGDLLKLAKQERGAAWLDAYDITMTRSYNDYVNSQKKRELGWYNRYFKIFQ